MEEIKKIYIIDNKKIKDQKEIIIEDENKCEIKIVCTDTFHLDLVKIRSNKYSIIKLIGAGNGSTIKTLDINCQLEYSGYRWFEATIDTLYYYWRPGNDIDNYLRVKSLHINFERKNIFDKLSVNFLNKYVEHVHSCDKYCTLNLNNCYNLVKIYNNHWSIINSDKQLYQLDMVNYNRRNTINAYSPGIEKLEIEMHNYHKNLKKNYPNLKKLTLRRCYDIPEQISVQKLKLIGIIKEDILHYVECDKLILDSVLLDNIKQLEIDRFNIKKLTIKWVEDNDVPADVIKDNIFKYKPQFPIKIIIHGSDRKISVDNEAFENLESRYSRCKSAKS